MALIFIASSSPSPGPTPEFLSDKLLHFGAYAALGFTILRALAGAQLTSATPARALIALLLTVLYGVSDEFHQSFVPGRTPDVMDVVADAIGAGAGIIVLMVAPRVSRKR
jgi:VanZ family protein